MFLSQLFWELGFRKQNILIFSVQLNAHTGIMIITIKVLIILAIYTSTHMTPYSQSLPNSGSRQIMIYFLTLQLISFFSSVSYRLNNRACTLFCPRLPLLISVFTNASVSSVSTVCFFSLCNHSLLYEQAMLYLSVLQLMDIQMIASLLS